ILLTKCLGTSKTSNGYLTQVEVDEVLCLVRHVAAKIPPNNAMPCWVVLLVKLLQKRIKNYSGDILLNVVLLHGLHSTVHCVLLHFIRHVSILDHCLLVRHVGFLTEKGEKVIFRFHTFLTSPTSLYVTESHCPLSGLQHLLIDTNKSLDCCYWTF
uniref:Uncharacterized protein n=1 Tax=Labrus bergylta TaxID=56723 RepID=A0A3Q3MIA5_9LABR